MQSPNVPPVVISTTVHLAVALAFSLTAFKERQFAVRKLVASVHLAEDEHLPPHSDLINYLTKDAETSAKIVVICIIHIHHSHNGIFINSFGTP